MPDRIAAGTLAGRGGASPAVDVRLTERAGGATCCAVFAKLRRDGLRDRLRRKAAVTASRPCSGFHGFASSCRRSRHPGFPTDMQAQMLALAALAKGTSVVVENVFENRFAHAGDLNRMGADVLVNGRTAVVRGRGCALSGARVTARDLRGGAALAIAGPCGARGNAWWSAPGLIDRGYETPGRRLLGASGGGRSAAISADKPGEEHP